MDVCGQGLHAVTRVEAQVDGQWCAASLERMVPPPPIWEEAYAEQMPLEVRFALVNIVAFRCLSGPDVEKAASTVDSSGTFPANWSEQKRLLHCKPIQPLLR